MLLTAKKDRIGSGVQIDLNDNQDLLVKRGVTISSDDSDAIFGEGNGQSVTIAGRVTSGTDDGVQLDGNNARLVITATGYVFTSSDDAVEFRGVNSTLVNRGQIVGDYGVYFYNDGGNGAKITNYGTIIGQNSAITMSDEQQLTLINLGIVTSLTSSSFEGDELRDTVINKGLMTGDINFYSGNDLYDGRGGIVIGDILGDAGNDTFRPGKGAEEIIGGLDTDTLDFRSTNGVRADLLNIFTNSGTAKGDRYFGIENILGSATGADTLRGNLDANTLKGIGGKDSIFGNGGNDEIYGGAGRDTLYGGADDDDFYFLKRGDGADSIKDFGNGIDALNFKGAAFGGLADGLLAASRFKSGTDNQAGDGNDRFIFNTNTDKLFFDADGTGGRAAILVAQLNDVSLTAGNIFIF